MEMGRMNELMAKYGATVDRVSRVGKHIKYYLTTPSGPRILVCSRTASDNRAIHNNEALLKRWSRP